MKLFIIGSKRPRLALTILVVWLGLIGVISAIAPSLSEATTGNQEEFLPANAESVDALYMRAEKFPAGDGIPAIVVFYSNGDKDQLVEAIKTFSLNLRSNIAPNNIVSVISPLDSNFASESLTSDDGSTAMVIVTIGGSPSSDAFENTKEWISTQALISGANLDLTIAVTGPAGILSDAIKVFKSIDLKVLVFTVGLLLILLLIIYRSPILAIVPLLIIGSALFMAQSLAALIAHNFDLPFNGQITAIMSILVFGAGTDYALFIISRYREELVTTNDTWQAMSATMSKIGPSIAGSAGTTIVAMFALTFASFGSFRSLGPMLAMAILIVLLVGLFVMPGVITIFGKWAFWPRPLIQQNYISDRGFWSATGRLVSRKPGIIFGVTFVGILLATIPSWSLVPSFNWIDGFPDDVESKVGYQVLSKNFPPGQLAPTELIITSNETNIVDAFDELEGLSADIEELDGISSVSGLTRPFGFPITRELAMSQGGARFLSVDGTTTRMEVILEDDPYSRTALSIVESIRETIASNDISIEKSFTVLVGGESAIQLDTKKSIDSDIRWLAPVSIGSIFLVLVLLLRSVVAPIYLVFSVVISFGAAFGLSVFVFQEIFSHPGVAYEIGVWMFIFLIALGADYNIFLISRIRESVSAQGYRKGVATAVGRTGGVITSAGIILAGTFGVLATLPLRDLFQLGFAIMLGVLIDTFIVRALLVPSIVAILGEWSWWPNKVRKTL